ncbi:hypothetical protein BHM03_00002009 [Ensete ventricosum]|uniref:Retrovirus-related Pol polyprotein from transposon TNT 1-94-like beta-barrel domain-containing protein n=1 Tax=Ensete ventricosum TaxID=4639 RepID=A0A445M9F8_ENSVE|nr:hypothetical protein BHM03_00002009 [Ensete ventricosum]
MDSGASHHITSYIQNLSMHNNYNDNDDNIIGDDKHLPITHTGSTMLNSHSFNFTLDSVLCAPHIK